MESHRDSALPKNPRNPQNAQQCPNVGRARHSVRAGFANQNALVATGGAQSLARPTHPASRTRTHPLAGCGAPDLAAIQQGWRSVGGAINPHPIFHPFAQAFVNGIHQDVFRLFLQLVMVAQPVIEEIPLPCHPELDRHKFFPIRNERFQTRFTRESDDGVQMVGHEQAEAAMPEKFIMVVRHRRENTIANPGLAKLVFARRHAFDGDEKAAAFRHPLRDGVRQFFTDGQIHAEIIMKSAGKKKPVGRARHSMRAGAVNQDAFVGKRRRSED